MARSVLFLLLCVSTSLAQSKPKSKILDLRDVICDEIDRRQELRLAKEDEANSGNPLPRMAVEMAHLKARAKVLGKWAEGPDNVLMRLMVTADQRVNVVITLSPGGPLKVVTFPRRMSDASVLKMRKDNMTITVRGRVARFEGDLVYLVDCTYKLVEDKEK